MNRTINVSLPTQLAELARAQVKLGYFSSLSEVIRAALRQFLFSQPQIPTFKLSIRGEKRVRKALENYKKGAVLQWEE